MDLNRQRLMLGEKLSLALVTIALALPTLWYGLGILKLDQVHGRVATYLGQLEQTARPLLTARSQALDEAARIEALLGLDPYPGQLDLLARVAETLPKSDVVIKEWNFQNGKLRITLSSSRRPRAAKPARPLRMDCLRVSPPFTTVTSLKPASQRNPSTAVAASGLITSTT